MRRMIDVYCRVCDVLMPDMMADERDELRCPQCGSVMEQQWWPKRRRERTQWDERDAVVVFRKPDGTFSFPARNDKPTPPGYERLVARSDREVAALEKLTGTHNERRWYDSNGRGFDDEIRERRTERINTF